MGFAVMFANTPSLVLLLPPPYTLPLVGFVVVKFGISVTLRWLVGLEGESGSESCSGTNRLLSSCSSSSSESSSGGAEKASARDRSAADSVS